MDPRSRCRHIAALLALAVGTSFAHGRSRPSEADAEAVRALHEAYRRAWLANDAEGVMRLFAPEAVLLPHHGLASIVGADEIRAFWFGLGPTTTITRLDLELDEVSVREDTGLVRGRSRVDWTVAKDATLERWTTAGTFLTVLRRGADGAWRITHHMWDDPPNQRL
jgi:uncharacterized protein (TIGR02246 family)